MFPSPNIHVYGEKHTCFFQNPRMFFHRKRREIPQKGIRTQEKQYLTSRNMSAKQPKLRPKESKTTYFLSTQDTPIRRHLPRPSSLPRLPSATEKHAPLRQKRQRRSRTHRPPPDNTVPKKRENYLLLSKKAIPLHSLSQAVMTEKHLAKVAQLVEHNLAKVRVAGSNPVFRSS